MAPIRPLLEDQAITEIMINGSKQVFVERGGRMQQLPPVFTDDQQLDFLVETLLRGTGRSVDARSPYVDSRLPDGSRVNIIIPPLCLQGPSITIRKFTRSLKEIKDLVKIGTMTDRMGRFLAGAVRSRMNIIFAGATGTGKTTTLGILSRCISESERIITIEDTAELDLHQVHVVNLECRPSNVEGEGAVELSDLLKNTLRMRPTRIIVGEIRGDEAVDMLQAITSGHEGCLAVLHASSPVDAITRLEMMVLSRGLNLPLWAVHHQISAAINLIVQHEMLTDGARKITRITEVTGVEDDRAALRNLWEYHEEGIDDRGNVIGDFHCTGEEPQFLSRFERFGVQLPGSVFAKGVDRDPVDGIDTR